MKLNKDKTVVLPFQPWTDATEQLSQEFLRLGGLVVKNSGRAKLLDVFYGPQLSNSDRHQHLIAEMQTRCSLWIHRARTLRDQVAILQQIILPVLWVLCQCVLCPPDWISRSSGFNDFPFPLPVQVHQRSTQSLVFLPASKGGLGLTSTSAMVQSLQLHML
ncbi:Pol Polyprotein [Phytophthora megakarya]|uniref:Pol Polyprotein n=1 Tax=Phytophthora megakarya TaxID=4795 RepID=A0A225W0J8_9STRA|nr:Pol Polyprotein [Phytophthora megakarya]